MTRCCSFPRATVESCWRATSTIPGTSTRCSSARGRWASCTTADVAHAMECAQAPEALAAKRQAALQALHTDRAQAMALLRSMQYSQAMPAAWAAMRRACRVYYEALARQALQVVVVS